MTLLIIPAFAENFPLIFNTVRICVVGITVSNWNENINNSSLPSSILYQDTTYVPLRFISEKMDKDIVWNGDSRTVGITDKIDRSTTIAKKPDLNGNIWTYSILSDNNEAKYLSIKDTERGFERRYDIRGNAETSYRLTDDAVWIVTQRGRLYKISFLNDENSQDGEEIRSFRFDSASAFDGKYLYIAHSYGGTMPRDRLYAIDLDTLEESNSYMISPYDSINKVTLVSSDENQAVLNFHTIGMTHHNQAEYEITFDKTNFTMGESSLLEFIEASDNDS